LKIKSWWNNFRQNELLKSGMNIALSSLFIGLFTIGFVVFKWKIYDVANARETLDILLNNSLWIFSIIILGSFCWLHSNLSRFQSITSFLATRSFDFFSSLVFMLVAGYAVDAFIIPLINLNDFYVFLSFFESVIFMLLSLSMWIAMDKNDPKKRVVLRALIFVATTFFVASIIRSLYS